MSRTLTSPLLTFTTSARSRRRGLSSRCHIARMATVAIVAFASLGATAAGPAQAAPDPAPGWSAKSPYGGISTVHCDKQVRTVQGSFNRDRGIYNGYVRARTCLIYFRNTSGTFYYQGMLSMQYIANVPGASDVFGGRAMSVRQSIGKATGSRDCGRIAWINGQTRYCYSPTVTFHRPPDDTLYAKAYVFDPAGNWHPMWSQLLRTF